MIDAILKDGKARPARQLYTSKRIFERLKEEHGSSGDRAAMLPLPAAPYEACEKVSTRVSSLSLVRYRTNDYFVPTEYGQHPVEVRNVRGEAETAILEMRFRRILVRPPRDKEKKYPELVLIAIYAQERDTPKGRERINWKLLSDLPVRSCLDAIEKLEWYAQLCKIETFYKILKSGCRAEEWKLRTAERLVNLIATHCLLSWRIFPDCIT